jgi:hypothetical protein
MSSISPRDSTVLSLGWCSPTQTKPSPFLARDNAVSRSQSSRRAPAHHHDHTISGIELGVRSTDGCDTRASDQTTPA